MNNELIPERRWFKRNWKWIIPITLLIISFIILRASSSLGGLLGDYGKAYADPSLYNIPMEKVQLNERVREVLGEIEPMGKLAILNGAIHYANHNKTVETTIKIFGVKGKAMLDISAERINDTWYDKKINVRIKNPNENKELIAIIKSVE